MIEKTVHDFVELCDYLRHIHFGRKAPPGMDHPIDDQVEFAAKALAQTAQEFPFKILFRERVRQDPWTGAFLVRGKEEGTVIVRASEIWAKRPASTYIPEVASVG